jgi:hypothetical protein
VNDSSSMSRLAKAPSVREARDLVRLEISYVLPPPASGNLTVQPTS